VRAYVHDVMEQTATGLSSQGIDVLVDLMMLDRNSSDSL
jgi:hypothetical protein